MKKLLVLLYIIASISWCDAQSENNTTTYYLIRHAEKDKSSKTNRNPRLIENGYIRALKWADYFDTIKLDAIYSTDYIRTKDTAKPTAESKGIDIIIYDPRAINYDRFLNDTKGKTVLIVGHSNTTPSFANRMIGEDKYKPIDETVNNKLFIVTINKEKISSKVIDVD